jgi:cytoskeletal protein CcmA (bactofilin family)
MFRRRDDVPEVSPAAASERITSVLAEGTSLHGKLTGKGGVRIEGSFEGEVNLDGLFVIGPTGRVTCDELRATTVIVAGAMRGDIVAEKVEIRASGRVWGDVLTTAIATDEGAFLRGQIQMEEELEEELNEAEEVVVNEAEKSEADGKKVEKKEVVKKEKKSKKAKD